MKSSNAMVIATLKFGFGDVVPYEKVNVFRSVVESFIRVRPRLCAKFRETDIEAGLGFIQYIIVLKHVESWENLHYQR